MQRVCRRGILPSISVRPFNFTILDRKRSVSFFLPSEENCGFLCTWILHISVIYLSVEINYRRKRAPMINFFQQMVVMEVFIDIW